MYPPIASEKLKPFHLHYSTWFKKYPGTHEALDPESTKKMINHYQMFTSCRHCAHCFTHVLFKTDRVKCHYFYFANEETEAQGHIASKWQTPKFLLLSFLLHYPYKAHMWVGKGGLYEPIQCKL